MVNYNDHDRAIMTIAFVRFIRMLMAEVMQAFDRGITAGRARERGEVLVDVEVEEPTGPGDTTSLMQRTLTGQFQVRMGGMARWLHQVQLLQSELDRQPASTRNANIAGLQARLDAHPEIVGEKRESLLAMLVGMRDEGCLQCGISDIAWQLRWWDALFGGQSGQDRPPPGETGPSDADIQDMAQEEEKVRRDKEREQQARERQQEEYEREEEAMLRYRASLLDEARGSEEAPRSARLSPSALRQWEDWEWFNILQEPPRQRRRTVLQVEVSGRASRDGPWLSRSLRVPADRDGRGVSVQLDFSFVQEPYPDDVETVVVPEACGFTTHGGSRKRREC